MSKERIELGKSGEELAVELLKKNGFKILERNFRTKFGEIDIIALEKDTLCFVEVKSRSSLRFGSGFEAVSGLKQKQIARPALIYLKDKNLLDKKARFDVISLTGPEGFQKIELIRNAFELSSSFTY
ncbi:MAG: YraN family protein [Candidatus Omnitrophica bacterium]|nr:YraN family protein [Candidatus Omnitrophota bacterium]